MGKTRIVESTYYGPYVVRCLGVVDIRRPSFETYTRWMDKYHQRVYFGTWVSYPENDIYHREDIVGWDIWVPTVKDNKDWRPIPGTEYAAVRPNAKRLPIAVSDAKIKRWLIASRDLLVNPEN